MCSHGLSIWGELKYGPDFKHFDYVNPDAPKGGSIRRAEIGTFDSVHPHIMKGVAAEGLGMVYDTLMEQAEDEPFSEYGVLVERIALANDHSWVMFYLRPEARWHDGSPLTAEDVAFSFNAIMEKGHPFYRSYYGEISGVEIMDNRTVKFTFSNVKNRELPLILGQLPIVSKAYYATHDFTKSTLEPPLGSGPYKIDALEPGKWIRYRRVADYWAKDLPIVKGRHNFDVIQYDYYRDATVAVEAFKAGEYDFRQENISKVWATAYHDFPALNAGKVKKAALEHQLPTPMQGFVFNMRRAKFEDRRVRKAIGFAFDFEWSNKNLFYGEYRRTVSYFGNTEFQSKGLPSAAELKLLEPFRAQVPPELFTEPYKLPETDGSGYARENMIQADALLKQAGWIIKDGKRVNEKTGETLAIEFLLSSQTFERVVGPFLRNLKRLGIEGSIRTVDSSQYVKRLEEFDFDVVVNVFAQSHSLGNEQIDYWHSSKADVPGSKNLAGIKNPAVDALVEKLVSANTHEDQRTAGRALDRVLLSGEYLIPHFHSRIFRILYRDKFARPEKRPPYALGLDTWWAKSERH